MTFSSRLGNFVIFIVLTVLTLGLYPIYFWITQMKTQTEMLVEIVRLLQKERAQ